MAHPEDEPRDDEVDETLVVDRRVDEKTVVVKRRSKVAAKPAARGDAAESDDLDDDEGTAVIDRSAGDESDRTVVVVRGASQEDERTIVVDRSDKTIAVDRSRRRKQATAEAIAPAADHAEVMRVLPSRRSLRLPPVAPDFGREAVPAVGAGAVDIYIPREIGPPPVAPEPVPRGADAFRADAPSMPSVTRRSRRVGAVAMFSFVGACVVSVVGLVLIVLLVVGG